MCKVNIYAHCRTQLNVQLIHICDKTVFSLQEKKNKKKKNKNIFSGLMLRTKKCSIADRMIFWRSMHRISN